MKLSPSATALLVESEFEALKALSLARLLDKEDFQRIQSALQNSSHEMASVSFAYDPVSLEPIEDPVVVLTVHDTPTAYIYSKASIQNIVRMHGVNSLDPMTNLPLKKMENQQQDNNRRRDVDDYFIELPKLTDAMKQISERPNTKATCTIELLINPNKYRVVFGAGQDQEYLNRFLKYLFRHSPNAKIESADPGPFTYGAQGKYARLWNERKLEFWFPHCSEFITSEVINELLNALTSPLELPSIPLPQDIPTGTLRDIADRDYKVVFPITCITPIQLCECLRSFYNAVGDFATQKKLHLTETVIISNEQVTEATITGPMFFGKKPDGAAGSAASAASAASVSTSSSGFMR